MGKLTKAQSEVLHRMSRGLEVSVIEYEYGMGANIHRRAFWEYDPVERSPGVNVIDALLRRGYVEAVAKQTGACLYRITEAGRTALEGSPDAT